MSIGNFVKRVSDIMRHDAGVNGDAQRIEQLTWMLFLKIYDDAESEWDLLEDNFESIIPEECRWRNWANTSVNNLSMRKGDELISFVNNVLFPRLRNLQLPPNCPKKKSVVKTVFTDIHNYMKEGVQLYDLIALINEFDFSDPNESHTFGQIYETILKKLQSAGNAGEFYTPRALTDFMAQHVHLKPGDSIADFACGTGGFLNSARRVLDPVAAAGTNEDRAVLMRSFYGIEKKSLPYLLCVTNLILNGLDEPNVRRGNALTTNIQEYGEKDKFDVILMNPPYGGTEKTEIQMNFPEQFRSSETADLFMALIAYRLKKDGRAAVIIPNGFLFGSGAKTEIKKLLFSRFNVHTIVRLPTSVFAPYTDIATNIIFFDNTGVTKETWFYRVDMPEGYKHFSKTKPLKLEHLNDLTEWWKHRFERQEDGVDKIKKFSVDEIMALDYNLDLCGYPKEQEEILPPKELIEKYQAERKIHEKKIDEVLTKILQMMDTNHEI